MPSECKTICLLLMLVDVVLSGSLACLTKRKVKGSYILANKPNTNQRQTTFAWTNFFHFHIENDSV